MLMYAHMAAFTFTKCLSQGQGLSSESTFSPVLSSAVAVCPWTPLVSLSFPPVLEDNYSSPQR